MMNSGVSEKEGGVVGAVDVYFSMEISNFGI
jgi:hypothetical protein